MLNYLNSALRQFKMYKQLGEKAMAQMTDETLNWQSNEDTNSVVMIVRHLHGNMLSRWTDFMTTDGEKPWRQRDAEFDSVQLDRTAITKLWEEGWQCLFTALGSITDNELDTIIYIRNDGHTVLEATNRQIAHYSYHVGQIVHIAKICSNNNWGSLSIPRNQSATYNAGKFAQEQEKRDFISEWIDKK